MKHRTLIEEQVDDLLDRVVTLDGLRYRVVDVNHIRNGVYSLALQPRKGETKWVEVLTESGRVVYVDN